MTTVQASYPGMPSLLDMTNRVLRETGCYPVTTINPGSTQSQVAVDAISDGIWQIYNRKRWAFTNTTISIPLVAGQGDYPTPADFDRISSPPTYNGVALREYSLDEWTTMLAPYELQSGQPSGSPSFFKVSPAVFTIWPTPDASILVNVPNLQLSYYKTPGSRMDITDGASSPNLPVDFVDCLVTFAKWRLKSFLEYPDAGSEGQRFEQLLGIQMARNDRGRKPNQMRAMYGPSMLTQGSWTGW